MRLEIIKKGIMLGITLIAIYLGKIFDIDILEYIGVLLYFSIFDAIGYWYLAFGEPREKVLGYRILQISQMGILYLLLMGDLGLYLAVGFAWWFGFCDLLYYIVLRQWEMLRYPGDMTWLWWTPYGIINRIMGRKTSSSELIAYGLLGFIVSLLYIIFR